MIELTGVSKSFDRGSTWALKSIDLHIPKGEWFVLLGSSGSGKSTLLKTMNRLIDDFSGTIRIDGQDSRAMDPVLLRRGMGYVFQGIGLFPHWTIEQNVAAGLRLAKSPTDQVSSRVDELLRLMELDPQEFRDRYPSMLSGGQRQRIGVARALATDPPCLLMDEPFGALDSITRSLLQNQMLDLKSKLGKTAVFVTHDVYEALLLGDRIGVLHEGVLEQIGTPADLRAHPATPFVRDLIQKPIDQWAKIGGMR